MTGQEKLLLPGYIQQRNTISHRATAINPPASRVRTIAEWEELQGLVITWTSYQSMLKEIVRAAKQETRVYIVCSNPQNVISYLSQAPAVDTVNVSFVVAPYNSVWSRDYGPWNAYTNDVDSLITIDWIYNRPRPDDDDIPGVISNLLGTPFYQTTTSPWDLVNTGGNFMTDGFGTAFASNLILTDNTLAAGFGVQHTSAEIDTIMNRFMGISRYLKMNSLPYDGIHHIDMHMKLLDEETLLVGQYPAGVSDGPQIEANLQYILANDTSVFGTPYNVIRIPMPSDGGLYPSTGGDYLTYTNSSFINKTIIVPTYNIASDTTALRIYRDALPGYTVTGINSTASISSLGALHCITKEIGTADPLLISHQALHDTYNNISPYFINALIKHRSGIQDATLYYRTDTTQPYQAVSMISLSSQIDHWGAAIPAQPVGTMIWYYIEARSASGKQQVRPLTAPDGFWRFEILGTTGTSNIVSNPEFQIQPVFPNPSKGITCIPVISDRNDHIELILTDLSGRTVMEIFDGNLKYGENKFFLDSWNLPAGAYLIVFKMDKHTSVEKLMVR